MNRTSRLILPVFILALGVALIGGAAWVTLSPPGASTGIPAIGGHFKLVAQDGSTVTDENFKGEPTLVFFGYTHCPDVCPTTLYDMTQVLSKLPGAKVHGLFISVDPERDTPAVMKDYMTSFDPRIIGLTGDRKAIDAVMKGYRVYAKKIPGKDGEYTMDHSAIVYLMDKQGRFVSTFDVSGKPQDAADKLKAYL